MRESHTKPAPDASRLAAASKLSNSPRCSGTADNLALAMRPVNWARTPIFALLEVFFGHQQ